MGNCLASKGDKGGENTPRKGQKQGDIDGEAPKQMVNHGKKGGAEDDTAQLDRVN